MQKKIRIAFEKRKYIVEPLLISLLTIFILCAGWAYILQETAIYEEIAVKNYTAGQEALLRQVSKEVKKSLHAHIIEENMSFPIAERSAVEELTKAEASGSRYWFLYSTEGVIFEENAVETRKVSGMSLKELLDYWKTQGGGNTEAFEDIIRKENSGSLSIIKSGKLGVEIVSINSIVIGQRAYFLGISTLRDYILSTSKANEQILHIRVLTVITSMNILILALLLLVKIYRSNREAAKLRRSISERNLQIQELSEKLSVKSEAVQSVSIYDTLTGLYNKKFFESLLVRVNYNQIKPVCIVIIDINGLDSINARIGYGAGDELLRKTAELIKKVCIETDVIARTGNSEFCILMSGAKEDQAYGTAESVNRQFLNTDNEGLTLSIGAAQMPDHENQIHSTMLLARKNMILAKMLDKNSSSSSIVNMLMETLSAFSREAVEHSERLRIMAISFGKHLGLNPAETARLAVAALLHDVGKIGITDSVLNKKGPLNDQEKEMVKRHSEIGYNILKAIPFLDEAAIDIQQHHECYDGKGYPQGLKGGEIGLNSRIINIIDSFDIMTHGSVYARTKSVEEALADLSRKSGKQYDPYLVDAFIKGVLHKLKKSREAV